MKVQSLRILAGLVLGLLLGAALSAFRPELTDAVLSVARPLGQLWLAALTMTVTPLVFGLVVVGIAAPAVGEGAVGRAFIWFAAVLVGACVVSAALSTAFLDLWPARAVLDQTGANDSPPQVASAGDWLAGFMPTNPFKAAADTAVAPLVVFALLFGFAARRIDPALRASLLAVIEAVVETVLVMVRWVLWFGPLGVAALAVGVGVELGAGAFGALLHYVVLVSSICLVIAFLAYPLTAVFGRFSLVGFARAAMSAQVVAVSTQSSMASLPAMIEAAPRLKVSDETAGVVLPLAVSIFRAASAAANVAVTVYLAHFHGVALGLGGLAVVVVVATVVSLAAVGLPAQVSFFASIAPVCLAVGVPVTLLPLLLAVESGPDIFRTLGNVTADLALTRIVGSRDAGRPASPGAPESATGSQADCAGHALSSTGASPTNQA
jgi:proton glutamate symport protein